MQLFVQATVFNSKLAGKAIFIEGHDVDGDKWNGNFLVKNAEGEYLTVVNPVGKKVDLHMENFDEEIGLKITVLTKGEIA